MKRKSLKIFTAILLVLSMFILVSCSETPKYTASQIVGKTKAEVEELYGRFDIYIRSEEGYDGMYLTKDDVVTFKVFFDESGTAYKAFRVRNDGHYSEHLLFAHSNDEFEIFYQGHPLRSIGYYGTDDSLKPKGFIAVRLSGDRNEYEVSYEVNDLFYRFDLYKTDEKIDRTDETPVGSYTIDGKSVDMYKSASPNEFTGEIYLSFEETEYMLTVTVSGCTAEDITFDSLVWTVPN